MRKEIQYMGQKVIVKCDEKCHKAWGVSARPKEQLSDDPDDVRYLGDDELGEAPVNPMTSEGGDMKPVTSDNKPLQNVIPNKWCVRQCERCVMSERGSTEEPELEDWSKGMYNQPWKHETQ